MNERERSRLDQAKIDSANLYREELYTDLKMGSIQVLTPVKTDGSTDPSRPVRFVAQTQVLSGAGPLPLSASIDAKNLAEAIDKFPEAIQQAMERLMEEARELQRQEASRIVVPKMGAPGVGGPGPVGGGPGGLIVP
jgi:hypothetical protein